MRTIEALPVKDYSRDELILMLSRLRKRPVSIPTFYRWCGELSITPKFRYSEQEAKRLTLICRHYSQGGKASNLPTI